MAKADACNNGDLEVVWSGLPTSKGIKQSLRYVKSQRQGKKAIMVIWKLSGVVLLLAWRAAQNHPQHCHLHSQTSEGRRLEKHTLKTVSTDITDSNTTDSFNNFWIIYKARIQIAILNQIIPFTNKRVVYVMLITNTAYLNI